MIYGRHPALEWLEGGLPVRTIYLLRDAERRFSEKIVQHARRCGAPLNRVDRARLTHLAGSDKHQGVVLEVELPGASSFGQLFRTGEAPLLGILDQIQDPQNLGAVLRSADGAGVHGIITTRHRSARLTPAAFKASAGAAAHVPLVPVTNLARTLDELRERGIWIAGADPKGDRSYTALDYRTATAFVLGSEGRGLRRLVREKCDFLVTIPMSGAVSSLNVSITAALLFYEARRQRDT